MTSSIPPIAFLGLVERAAQVRDGNTNLFKYNLIGLKQIILSSVFPLSLPGTGLAFAFHGATTGTAYHVLVRDQNGNQVGDLNIEMEPVAEESTAEKDHPVLRSEGPVILAPEGGWVFAVLSSSVARFLFPGPGQYFLDLHTSEGEYRLGTITFVLIEPPPLTAARVAAIRSDPSAIKAVRVHLECNKCHAALRAYVGLQRIDSLEADKHVWYEDLPNKFVCVCGALRIDLSIMRRNLHALLGARQPAGADISVIPLYERSALDSIRRNFAQLLEQDAPEQTFQAFIQENPILLHQFSPESIYPKAPILTHYNTDFAIVNHQSELLLIELERPQTRVLKKDGGLHSELQHAFDQAREWLHTSDEQRLAVLDCIGIDRGLVGAVRAVVVAGKDAGNDPEMLRKLKGADYGRIRLLTYDDLLAGLDTLIRAVAQM